jgi:hypothetical protein
MAQFRNNTQNALRSTTFGGEQAERPHSVGRELNDLREDVENAFTKLEAHTATPIIHSSTLTYSNGDKQVTADSEIHGVNFLAGQAQAYVTINDLKFTAVLPGTGGNSLNITVTVGAPNDALLATVAGDDLTIRLAADGAGAAIAADNQNSDIITEVNAKALGVLQSALASGAAGDTSFTAAVAKTLLAGGTGAGASLTAHQGGLAGVSITVNTMTDTMITVSAGAGTVDDATATSVIGVILESNRAKSNVLHATAV